MKKIIFASIVAGAIFCGCTKEDYQSAADGNFTMTFRLPDYELTRAATKEGVENLNENLINSCFYFLFKEDGTGSPAVKGSVAGLSKQGAHTETIPVSTNTINNVLFKDGRNCRAFVVVNPTADLEKFLRADHTLSELRNATLQSLLDGEQDNFVMVYDDELTVSSRTDATVLTATLDLKRLACKFTFHVKVAEEVTDDGNTWIPVTNADGLNVTVTNFINKTTLSGFKKSVMTAGDYFESSPVPFEYKEDETIGGKTFKCFDSEEDSPIYSYPMAWEFTDRYEPCLIFKQVWKKEGTTEAVPRYYKLVLGQKSITSNEWYDITVKLDVLGSFDRTDPTELFENMDYLVKGWSNAFQGEDPNTPADIKDMRYLMTYGSKYVMDNVNTITIPFTSSHKCYAKVISATYDNFRENTVVKNGKTLNSAKYTADADLINITNDGIVLTHNLVNTMNSMTLEASEESVGSFDYCKYTFTIKLYQDGKETTGESEYCKIITVEQNPALVLEAIKNDKDGGNNGDDIPSGYTNPISGNTDIRHRNEMYTVFVNGNNYYHNKSSNRNYMEVYGKYSTTNSGNPNLYSISVSKIDDGVHIIGDPRRATYWTETELDFESNTHNNNVDKINPVSAPHYDGQTGGDRTLKYYYPTYEDADHENMIAPKFLIVSGNSFCNSYDLNKQAARQRCATYQEYGYPAGRWRLPTLAELQFVATLMAYGKMPTSFADGGDYWTATGVYTFSISTKSFTANASATTAVLRCVYDEWYWENSAYDKLDATTTPTYETFVWGDMDRANFK